MWPWLCTRRALPKSQFLLRKILTVHVQDVPKAQSSGLAVDDKVKIVEADVTKGAEYGLPHAVCH